MGLHILLLIVVSLLCLHPQSAAEECADATENTIASSPLCLFSQQCDCALVIAEYPCGTTIESPTGSIAVDDICAKTCCWTCEDVIADHPACLFGGICSCADVLALSPCGSDLESGPSSTPVNDLCAKTCNACSSEETGAEDTAFFQGPVSGSIPMGVNDGKRTTLSYALTEDGATFELKFPDSLSWTAFQMTGSADHTALLDGRFSTATAGYDCVVTGHSPDVPTATCRGRAVRHVFTRYEDLPDISAIEPGAVTACTEARAALVARDEKPFCSFDANDVTKTSTIIAVNTAGGEFSMVTDVQHEGQADMFDMQVAHENGYFTASWSRSRDFPMSINDGDRLVVRWVASPRIAGYRVVNDLQYHGVISEGTWQRGYDYLYLNPAAQAKATPGYHPTMHVNMHAYKTGDFEEFRALFLPSDSVPGGSSQGACAKASRMALFLTAIILSWESIIRQ